MATFNDKLKGSYYRVPMTKLASRTAIINQINELIDYFNSLNVMLSNCFKSITDTRENVKDILARMNAIILHFQYILDNYKTEVDVHIAERLSNLIETFTNSFDSIVENFNVNLFSHTNISDDYGSNNTKNDINNLEEWDKSISMNATDLGIRWFGGKFSDSFVVNEINNVFHLVKVNTFDGNQNEDIINSKPILELFIKTPKGMSWLILGENGSFGHNIIVKYQSKSLINNIKIESETHHNPKEYDLNKFDLNLFIETLLDNNDISGKGNVYIKVKTNIPSNSLSGRESYFISTGNNKNFNDSEEIKSILNINAKLLYTDNKDVQILAREEKSIEDISNEHIEIDTQNINNPVLTRKYVSNSVVKSEGNVFTSEISNKESSNGRITNNNIVKNPENTQMVSLMDNVSGRVVHHEEPIDSTHDFYDKNKFDPSNKEYTEDSRPKYYEGEQVEDFFDYRNVGKLNLVNQNENMFEIDASLNSGVPVIHNDKYYGESKSENTVINKLFNNGLFDSLTKTSFIENRFKVLSLNGDDFEINTIANTKQLGVLLGTSKGIFIVKDNKFVLPVCGIGAIIEYNGVIYIGSTNDTGIYKYDNIEKAFVRTNIVSGTFNNFSVDEKGYVYALSNRGSFVSSEGGNYDINNLIFTLIEGEWYSEHDVSKNFYNNDPSFYRVGTSAIAENLTHRIDDKTNYKIIFYEPLGKWFIFNDSNKSITETYGREFKNFVTSKIYERFGNNIQDIICKGEFLYISVENTEEDISFVYKYDGYDFEKINYYLRSIKNDRNILEKAIYLDSISSLTNRGV